MNWLEIINNLVAEGKEYALVTVTRVSGSAPCEVASKVIVTLDSFYGTIGGGKLELLLLEEARKCLSAGSTNYISIPLGQKTDQCCGGLVECFIESFKSKNQLYVFGSGHVGIAVAQVLSGSRFQVNLIDERAEWVQSKLIPNSVQRIQDSPLIFFEKERVDVSHSYFVIMTHSHDLDFEILKQLIKLPAKYLGLIGSESKWKRFSQQLRSLGVSEEQISKVVCPIGAQLHSKNPKEIAIALAHELLTFQSI